MTSVVADRLLLLVAGLVIDAVFGDMPALFRYLPHPVILAGRAIAFFDRKRNRETRSETSRRERGIVTVIVLVGGAALLGLAVERVCRGNLVGGVVEAVMIAILIAQRGLYEHVAAVAAGLATGGLAGGREAVRHIVGRDPASLDAHGVARAAIESLAENFSDGVVAPILWIALGGLVGGALYKAINTADSMIGHRDERHKAFGWAAARFDDLVNLPASRFAALWLILAALLTRGASARDAAGAVWRDAARHRSPNAGWPEAAMAGALGLKLAGPRVYGETLVDDVFMGSGRREADAADIRRALRLFTRACAIQAGTLAAAAVWALRWG
jgi:adenosylcobinamide-phosphate synthase